jgi:predicted AAA+ superfamily ATPase
MIKKELIREILLENREDAQSIHPEDRNIELKDGACYVLTGIRQCGKSWLMISHMQKLASQYGWDHILYFNFEDERLLDMDHLDLNQILEGFIELTGVTDPYCFFDELQNIEGWEKFARRLADRKMKVCITGSNAKMLSREIATTLGGRYISRMIYPYSFRELLNTSGWKETDLTQLSGRKDALLNKELRDYFEHGGFPGMRNSPDPSGYMTTLYQNIYLGDIAARSLISNTALLRILLRTVAERIGTAVSYNRLANLITSIGEKTTAATMIRYLENARESYLIFSIGNVIGSLEDRQGKQKYYFMDNGILRMLVSSNAALLENLVAVTLYRKYYSAAELDQSHIFYYEKGVEVDFYISDTRTAVQVSYTVNGTDSESTVKREVNALLALKRANTVPVERMVIVTYEKEELPEQFLREGIELLSLKELMLDNTL